MNADPSNRQEPPAIAEEEELRFPAREDDVEGPGDEAVLDLIRIVDQELG